MGEKTQSSTLAFAGGIVTIFLTLILLFVGGRLFNSLFGQLLKREVIVIYFALMAVHIVCGIAMLIGSHYLQFEEHLFVGSTLTLVAGIIGFITLGGIFIGPIIATIAAILGYREEFM